MLERIVMGVLVLIGVAYMFGAFAIQVPRLGDPIGPRAFPFGIGVAFLCVTGALLLKSVFGRVRSASDAPGASSSVVSRHELLGVVMVALTVGYFIMFETVGYVLSTFVYLTILIVLLRPRGLGTNIAVAATFSSVSYLVFAKLLGVRLPDGLLG
jgi:putative tricarboxylic transport membrane protein